MSSLIVHFKGPDIHLGTATINGMEFPCALGRAGLLPDKQEGDGGTPIGSFPLRELYYRADRMDKPVTGLKAVALDTSDGWADDSAHPEYNKHITLPYQGSHESLWRDDHVYDLILVVGYNDEPPVPGKGSAIFIHLAREGYTPTAGCIAFSKPDFLKILEELEEGDAVNIG